MKNVLIGVGVIAGLGLVAAAIFSGTVEDHGGGGDGDELDRARDEVRSHISVSSGCTLIELREGHSPEAYEEDLDVYLALVLPHAQELGMTTADEIAEFVLTEILPECIIPPIGGYETRPDISILFINMRGRIVAMLPETDLPDLDASASLPNLDATSTTKQAKFAGT